MSETKSSNLPLILSLIIVVVIAGCWFFIPSFQSFLRDGFEIITSGNKQRIQTWVNGFGFWGPVIIIVAMVVQIFLIVVSTVFLMLIAILCYGPIWGSLIAWAGLLCASTTGYFLGRTLGKDAVNKLMSSKTSEKVHGLIEKHGYKAVFFARLTPITSNDAVSFIAGVANMHYLKFISATFLGVLPLTILLAWLGESWVRLKTGLIWGSAIALVGVIAYYFYKKFSK